MRRERTLARFALLCVCLLALSGAARARDLLPKFDEYAQAAARAELFPTSEANFFVKVARADFTFVKDAAGLVTHLVFNQHGRQMNAKKIK